MSLITHCPACGTTFKVVSDQLKISDGWVRCGQCTEVFDTAATLRKLELAEVAPSVSVGAAPAPPISIDGFNDALLAMVSMSSPEEALDIPPPSAPSPTPVVPDILLEDSPGALIDGIHAFEREKLLAQSQATVSKDISVSFLTQTKAPHAQTLAARVAFGIMGFLLLLALVGQVVFHVRDNIASADPRLKPALLQVCAWLSCQISPLRQIESMTVDSSSFNKQRDNVYRLNFVVKNTASKALARPAIELTLTDAQDMPLLRRVFTPAELSAKALGKRGSASDVEPMAAASEWVGSYLVAIASTGDETELAKTVAGYRILAFYP